VLDEYDPLQRTGEELDHVINAVVWACTDVIDDGVLGVDRPVGVPVLLVDRVAVAHEQLLDLTAVGDLLVGEGHVLAPLSLI
jgi:hypothetical protein